MSRGTSDVGDVAVRGIADRHRGTRRHGRVDAAPAAPRDRRARGRGRAVRRFSAVAVVALALGAPIALDPGAIAEQSGAETALSAPPSEAGADEGAEGGEEVAEPGTRASTFARFEDLDLVLEEGGVRLVAYHEAAFDDALPLDPVGTNVENDNQGKFTDPGPAEGPDYAILNARDRPTAATSAVDIAFEPNTPIVSLVSGVVTEVEEYRLYGRHRDHRIEIAPGGRSDIRVVIIHVEQPEVSIGDEVIAGETVLAPAAVLFPFESQIDRYVGDPRGPHIHVEVKRDGS